MNKTRLVLVAVSVLILFAVLKATPQQQQSGGQAVTVTSGTITANAGSGTFGVNATQLNGVAISTGNGVSGTGVQRVAVVSDNTAFNVNALQSGTWNAGLSAGTNKVGITYPYTSCGTTGFTQALQAMPTSSTAITATTTCVLGIDVSNTSGGSLTVTVSDNQGTPINLLNAVTLLAGETRTYNWSNGRKFTSGIKVQASGAGVTYLLEGLQ